MKLPNPVKILYYRIFPALLMSDEAYMGLTIVQNGILFKVLNHQALNGSVPAAGDLLARVVGADTQDVEEFLRVFPKLRTLEDLEGGASDRLAVPFLYHERREVLDYIQERRRSGQKGGRAAQARAREATSLKLSLSSQAKDPDQAQQEEQTSSSRILIAAAAEAIPFPPDLRRDLVRLGIGSQHWDQLLEDTGGPRGLRAALEQLSLKLDQDDIRSPSGFFLMCAAELAGEGMAAYDLLNAQIRSTAPSALLDARWRGLPEPCLESLAVLRAWFNWWTLRHEDPRSEARALGPGSLETAEAWMKFVEAVLLCHPAQVDLEGQLADQLEQLAPNATLPGMARRVRVSFMAKLMGVVEGP